MPGVQLKSEQARQSDGIDVLRRAARDRDNIKPRISLVQILITLGTVAVASLLSWATWQVYMGAPWTRDGTVRAYVVTIALRRVADRFGLLRHVWHPALFVFACYMITLSSIVLILAR